MLRTNLSTRPFYNERAVRLVMAGLGAALLALLAYDVVQGMVLARRVREVSAQSLQDETRARELRASASRLRAGIQTVELERVQSAAAEANALIAQRTFSWTEIFNEIEATLPPGVMVTSLCPEVDELGLAVTLIVIGREVEEVDRFMDRLEADAAFTDVLSTEESATDDGHYRVTIVGRYSPGGALRAPEQPARRASAGR
jgi:Tfp pilus assembly protein PilN